MQALSLPPVSDFFIQSIIIHILLQLYLVAIHTSWTDTKTAMKLLPHGRPFYSLSVERTFQYLHILFRQFKLIFKISNENEISKFPEVLVLSVFDGQLIACL